MRRQELHPAQRGNLASGPAIAAPDREEHVQTGRSRSALPSRAWTCHRDGIRAHWGGRGYGATEAAHPC